jgi:chromate reductase, NAD(P)H dehydrogenase (quinone)
MNDFRILSLAGSLRRASLHRGLVRAAGDLTPEGVVIEPYEKLGDLPFFNQDVEERGNPAPVRDKKVRDDLGSRRRPHRYPPSTTRHPRRPDHRARLGLALPFSPAPQTGRHRRGEPGWGGNGARPDGPPSDPLARPRLRHSESQMLIPYAREKLDVETGDLTDEQTRQRMRRFLDALVEWSERLTRQEHARDRRPV